MSLEMSSSKLTELYRFVVICSKLTIKTPERGQIFVDKYLFFCCTKN